VLDLSLIRNKTDFVKAEISKLSAQAPIDKIVELDKQRRSLLQEVEVLRQKRNRVSKEIGKMRDQYERQAKIAEMRRVGAQPAARERAGWS
jgi:seryl-tRNA synthetase